MSLKAHQGHEQSRRDDLESLGFVMVYLLKEGKLPWIIPEPVKTKLDVKDPHYFDKRDA